MSDPTTSPGATGRTGDTDAQPVPGASAGGAIVRASWIGTVVFTVSAIATAIAPHTFVALGVGVSMVLFLAGIVVFLWAFAVAVGRSRTDLIGMGGLFFLAGSAPRHIRRSLLGSLGVEVLVGLATAAVHPFTPLAFGVLVPMYGLALCGLWAARHGTFPPRPPEEPSAKQRKAARGSGRSSDARSADRAGSASSTRSRKGGRVTPPGARSKAPPRPASRSASRKGATRPS